MISLYHPTTPEIAGRRAELAPHTHEAFEAFSRAVFADGALDGRTKQLIAAAERRGTAGRRTLEIRTRADM